MTSGNRTLDESIDDNIPSPKPWCSTKVSLQELSLSFCVPLVHHFVFSVTKNTRKEETDLIVALGDAEGFLGFSRFVCYHKVSLALDHIWHW